jgi:predicted transposase YbfD/YdcC
MTNIHKVFRTLRDPRVERNKKHNLLDIITLSILAVLCGADSYDEIEFYGKENFAFLKQFLRLKNGIPSHDTINRVFQMLNPREFERCFVLWAQGLKDEGILDRVIAIDGKTVRGSRVLRKVQAKDSFHNKSPLHSVHAWSCENGICLGQMACGEKTNEITTIPQLLDMIDINGSIITIDAMGTQTAIAEKIVENGGDYTCTAYEVRVFLRSKAIRAVWRKRFMLLVSAILLYLTLVRWKKDMDASKPVVVKSSKKD